MAEDKYPTLHDASLRIHSSLVQYNGEYVWVTGPKTVKDQEENVVYTMSIETREITDRVPANDPLFDVTSPPLGWMQTNNKTVLYVSRATFRRQKQGLSSENTLFTLAFNGAGETNAASASRLDNGYIQSKAFSNMLNNRFRTYFEAISFCINTKINKENNCVGEPLSRDYCLVCKNDGKVYLFKRLVLIGEATMDGVKLLDAFNNSLTVTALADLGVTLTNA